MIDHTNDCRVCFGHCTCGAVPTSVEIHKLFKTQLEPEVFAWCTCGARFDAFGNKGALNKLQDHILANPVLLEDEEDGEG